MNRRVLRALLVLVCILITVASVSNVFLDNSDVRALAEQTGCGLVNASGAGNAGNAAAKATPPSGASSCAMTKMERSPIEQSFELVAKGGVTAHVSCMRTAILFGTYQCTKECNG